MNNGTWPYLTNLTLNVRKAAFTYNVFFSRKDSNQIYTESSLLSWICAFTPVCTRLLLYIQLEFNVLINFEKAFYLSQLYFIIIIDFFISLLHLLSIILIPDLHYNKNFPIYSKIELSGTRQNNSILGYYNANLISRMLFIWFPKVARISINEGLDDTNVPLVHRSKFSSIINYEKIKYIEKVMFNQE